MQYELHSMAAEFDFLIQRVGNLVADVVGVLFTGTINRLSKQVVPDPMLTPQQETFETTLSLNMAGQVCLSVNAGLVSHII